MVDGLLEREKWTFDETQGLTILQYKCAKVLMRKRKDNFKNPRNLENLWKNLEKFGKNWKKLEKIGKIQKNSGIYKFFYEKCFLKISKWLVPVS